MSPLSRMGDLRRLASARSFTNLFQHAVDQLGSDRAPVRIGGLYALELLAQEHPRHRPAAVGLLCAYLRMPVSDADLAGGDELQVRLAAQRILVAHLRPADPARFWPGTSLDLTGATLVELDLSGCRIDGTTCLDRTELCGATRLRGTVFVDDAAFRDSTWHFHAWLERAVFHGRALFDGAAFRGDAWFGESTFAGRTTFNRATFGGHAWFGGAQLRGPVSLAGATFHRSAGFRGAQFPLETSLHGVTFTGPARVSRTGDAWNLCPPGWRVEVDPDNWCVGDLVPTYRRTAAADPRRLG